MKLPGLPAGRQGHGRHLAHGVDSPVGAPCGHHGTPSSGEALKYRLNLTLNRTSTGLKLPPQELGPVVV
jgi:hypothetical protein